MLEAIVKYVATRRNTALYGGNGDNMAARAAAAAAWLTRRPGGGGIDISDGSAAGYRGAAGLRRHRRSISYDEGGEGKVAGSQWRRHWRNGPQLAA